ncbi:MAG: hypothetical protein O9326_17555 [Microcystis sp. LE19-338.1B]|nr:hypothetical protein [Microcystis sp. LE19-338.1B]
MYIRSFEREEPGFHLHITSIYGRFCEDPNERQIGVFCPIWTLERDGALQSAVKNSVRRYQRQMEIGHTTLHHQAKEYWKNKYGLSEQEVESLPTLYKQYMKEREDDTRFANESRIISAIAPQINHVGSSRLCVIIFAYGVVKCLLGKTFRAILRIFYQYRPRFHTETRRA